MSMFGTSKPTASLSSSLLARKGTARPAMRPQGFGGFGAPQSQQDDLGWNDMGHDRSGVEQPAPAPVLNPVAVPIAVVVPPVLVQREALVEEFAVAPPTAEAVVELTPVPKRSVSVATAARMERETRAKRTKAAFTLRLDQDRHLRLRLASAVHNISAQTLVTEALDTFLQGLPEVEELIAQLPPKTIRKKGNA